MPLRRTSISRRNSDSRKSKKRKTQKAARLAKRATFALLLGALGSYALAEPTEPTPSPTNVGAVRIAKGAGVHAAIHHRLKLSQANVAVFRASGAIEREEALHHECLEDRFGLQAKKKKQEPERSGSAPVGHSPKSDSDAVLADVPEDSSESTEVEGLSTSTSMHLSDIGESANVAPKAGASGAKVKAVESNDTVERVQRSETTGGGNSLKVDRIANVVPQKVQEKLASELAAKQAKDGFEATNDVTETSPSTLGQSESESESEPADTDEQLAQQVIEVDADASENSEPERIQYGASAKPPQMLLSGSRRRLGDRIKRIVRGDEANKSDTKRKTDGAPKSDPGGQTMQVRDSLAKDVRPEMDRIARSIPPTALRDPVVPDSVQQQDPSTQGGIPGDNPVLMLLAPETGNSNSSRNRDSRPPSYEMDASDERLSLEPLSLEPSNNPSDTRVFDVSQNVKEDLSSTGTSQLEEPLDSLENWVNAGTDEADGKECPGAPDGSSELEHQPDDIEVEQDAHPYDAPAAKSIDDTSMSAAPAIDFTQREIRIHNQINRTLSYFLEHPETVVRRGPWALMHATLPFGVETEIIAGNRKVNAIGWMCYNGVCARQRMFQATRSGFRTNVGPGVQGHEGQFLAILAQSRVSSDYPIKIGKREYTIADLARYEMATCRERSELTFKLIGLSYYLEPDQRWRDNRGHYWTLEKMVADEMSQPVNGVACGGTHRLMGLSFAIIERQRAGLPIKGTWARAEAYLNDYVNYTMTLQNPDGSFSTNWFEGRGNKQDTERKVQTTGHMLEWLIYTLPDEYLRSPRIQVSIEYLLNSVGAQPSYDWPIGPRGHALRALALYNQRVFGAEQGALKQYIASHPNGPDLR
ncbi:MAG: hypothetical protein ACE361_09795 [Aureliella sp.]